VANLRTEAKKTPDGKYYIVNGEKKWCAVLFAHLSLSLSQYLIYDVFISPPSENRRITNGIFADFFTVAVRTGGPGMGGISLLLIERTMPGVTTRQMQCSGVWSSGTTYITFEDVKASDDLGILEVLICG
jgi:alkylation response protein AidB-like acyl-CoA dehydrogenase